MDLNDGVRSRTPAGSLGVGAHHPTAKKNIRMGPEPEVVGSEPAHRITNSNRSLGGGLGRWGEGAEAGPAGGFRVSLAASIILFIVIETLNIRNPKNFVPFFFLKITRKRFRNGLNQSVKKLGLS